MENLFYVYSANVMHYAKLDCHGTTVVSIYSVMFLYDFLNCLTLTSVIKHSYVHVDMAECMGDHSLLIVIRIFTYCLFVSLLLLFAFFTYCLKKICLPVCIYVVCQFASLYFDA